MGISTLKKESAFGATLLITGCCIGAGMLGLPVVSALAGFIPSTCAMLLCYGFTTATGLLLLEATLWFDQRVNLLSIAHFAFGKIGKAITWFLFLFLFYCLFVAYMEGGGQLFHSFLAPLFNNTPVARGAGIFLCSALVGAIAYFGANAIDKMHRVLMMGLGAAFSVLICLGLPQGAASNLLHSNWISAVGTLPLLLICFGYQNLVPSLTYFLKRNVKALRFSIIVGNFIPFLLYFVWNYVVLGLIQDPHSASVAGSDMVTGLLGASQSPSVNLCVKMFSLFAILTSFIPNTMTFVDFLKDGIKLPSLSRSAYDLLILSIALVPPFVFTLFNPHLFLKALGFAGGFIDVLLFGILPAAIVYVGRYIKNIQGPYIMPGGRLSLLLIVLMSIGFLLLR